MNIFVDMHNSGLAHSLHLLLEKRLGHNLYFPVGMDWAEENHWFIHAPYNYSPETAKQYLQLKPDYIPKDGYYEVQDLAHNYTRKHITLEQFKNMEIDIVIATVPEHIESFKKLAQMKNAKFILQVGNIWWDKSIDFTKIPNLMSATIEYPVPASTHVVWYHEEFSDFFQPTTLPGKKQIVSFINCLRETGHFQKYYELKAELPEYELLSYGGSCDQGVINTTREIAQIMQESYFGWHCKKFGDGYGIIFHEWFAVGKPIITCFSDYEDKLGGKMLIDMETAIDADVHSTQEIAEILKTLPPEKYRWMCQQARNKFRELVNFDKDAQNIKSFIDNLV